MAILENPVAELQRAEWQLRPRRLRGLRRPGMAVSGSLPPQVTIVVPTRGEAGNIGQLVARVDRALGAVRAEILFVDDSDDETPEVIRATAARSSRTVRLLHREPGHRDGRLGGAVIAGFQLARAPWAIVLDGDLQHPPEVLPALMRETLGPDVDLVYGTRYVGGGDAAGLSSARREWVSSLSTRLSKALFPRKLSGVSDPMSGLFAVRLSALELPELKPVGYKVLLEILANSRIRTAVGVPFSFQERHSGESKASLAEGGRFLLQLSALRLGMTVSRLLQVVAFLAVGISGVGVNTLSLWLLSQGWLDQPYLVASGIATNVAVVWNFALLEAWVFRKVKQRSMIGGFLRFWLVSMALLPVQLGLLAVAVEAVGLNPVVGNIAVLTVVFVLRYLLTSMWVYASKVPTQQDPLAPAPGSLRGRSIRRTWPWNLSGLTLSVAAMLRRFPATTRRSFNKPVKARTPVLTSRPPPGPVAPAQPSGRAGNSGHLGALLQRYGIVLGLVALTAVVVVLCHVAIGVVLTGWTISNLLMLTVSVLTLARQLYAWQVPGRSNTSVDLDDNDEPTETFTIIVPARHEGEVLARTLRRILDTDYPHVLVQVLVAIADDDHDTLAVARAVAKEFPDVIEVKVVELAGQHPTKPLSLQAVYRQATGSLVGIADAESIFSEHLLRSVNTLARRNRHISIFQGGVALMNTRSHGWRRPTNASAGAAALDWVNRGTSWWRAHNCLEYYFWFRSRLHLSARNEFIPLGGNTLFIRREVLFKLDGWKNLLTEDCDFGTRASIAGFKTMVFYHPDLVTKEQTPDSILSLIKQRTRWHGGFLQVLALRDWRRVPGLRSKILAFETLATPLFAAYCGIALPIAITLALTLQAPVTLVIISVLPLLAAFLTAVVSAIGIGEFNRLYGYAPRRGEALLIVITTPIYQLALSIAALRAIQRMLLGQNGWEKTTHLAESMDTPAEFYGSELSQRLAS